MERMIRWTLAIAVAGAFCLACGTDDGGPGGAAAGGSGGAAGEGGSGGEAGQGGTGGDAGQGGTGGDAGQGGSGGGPVGTPCERAHACPDLPNRDELLGEDVDACESMALPPNLEACLAVAETCDDLADCTRCTGPGDTGYCTATCSLAVSCDDGVDAGQCSIDCSNYTVGLAGCFHGYERACWLRAIDSQSCDDAAACKTFGVQ